VSFWRPGLDEIGPTRLGHWMLVLRLGWLARPFGIGVHSDAQLTTWACEREGHARRAFRDAMHSLQKRDRGEAIRLWDKWEGA